MQQASKDKNTIRLKLTPEDRDKDPYHYIPFTVPTGTECIEVKYDYSGAGVVIDMGLFAPGKIDFPAASNFRGWSGSNKKHVVLCKKWATPGYLPGPVAAGKWHIILGLYKIPEKGCTVEVNIETHRRELPNPHRRHAPKTAPSRRAGEASKWLKGDLQVHTIHSDGDSHPLEVVEAAKQLGLDFLALTDHNTISQHVYTGVVNGLIVLPGEEVTTYKGHMNVIGLREWVDFRITNTGQLMLIHRLLAAKKALHYVNHPKPNGPPWEWGHIEDIGGMEVWQGAWENNNWHSLKTWHQLLAKGHRILGLGGSDAHKFKEEDPVNRLGTPTVWVLGKPSISGVIEGIREGKIVVTNTPHGPFIELTAKVKGRTAGIGGTIPPGRAKLKATVRNKDPDTLLRIISGGKVLWVESATTSLIEIDLTAEDNYIAADIVSSQQGDPWQLAGKNLQVKAITNPIYMSHH